MRGLKSTLFLIVVLGGLGAYVYFVTWKTPEGAGDSTAAKKEKVFASLEADKIDELKVSSSAGDSTTLKKENGAWQVPWRRHDGKRRGVGLHARPPGRNSSRLTRRRQPTCPHLTA